MLMLLGVFSQIKKYVIVILLVAIPLISTFTYFKGRHDGKAALRVEIKAKTIEGLKERRNIETDVENLSLYDLCGDLGCL